MKNINLILKNVLNEITPSKKEISEIDNSLKSFVSELKVELEKLKVDADIFVGGSFAKKTLIKKGQYDVDLFVRFEEKHKDENMSEILERAIRKMKNCRFSVIHGSRDYFKIDVSSLFFIEVVPVLKIRNPRDAENVTDLSYFHVNYIKRKLTGKLLDEVQLAKAFCHANKCYGAESYVNGFSGYAIELLVYYYKSFLNFLRRAVKIEDKQIIDIEKLYKNKQEIFMNVNSAKLKSPIVLIDPTFKERNVAAALSDETFKNFKEASKKFLENPDADFFKVKEINLDKIKRNALIKKFSFVKIKLETAKQEGDVAGTKLIKFYKHLSKEIGEFYSIKDEDFEYDGEKSATCFFVAKSKGKRIFNGPSVKDKKSCNSFKKRHKKTFEKKGRLYSEENIDENLINFIKDWRVRNSEKIREMYIESFEVGD